MIKRIVEVSSEAAHLSLRLNQLVITTGLGADSRAREIPCEDLGVVVIEHPQVTYTHQALCALAEVGVVMVVCGSDHTPLALLTPLLSHSEVVPRVHDQIAVKQPVRKRLWQQIIRAKIRNQASVLGAGSPAFGRLLALVPTVRSGDPTNVEAEAARIYWSSWLEGEERVGDRVEETFRRDCDRIDGPNAMLNYGYAIVRAAVARALVGAGLMPALGLHHHHRSNAFCLADDMVEPLRPLVDSKVRELWRQGVSGVDRTAKIGLLGVLHQSVQVGDQEGPLFVGLHRYVSSLVLCYRREATRLIIPSWV